MYTLLSLMFGHLTSLMGLRFAEAEAEAEAEGSRKLPTWAIILIVIVGGGILLVCCLVLILPLVMGPVIGNVFSEIVTTIEP